VDFDSSNTLALDGDRISGAGLESRWGGGGVERPQTWLGVQQDDAVIATDSH